MRKEVGMCLAEAVFQLMPPICPVFVGMVLLEAARLAGARRIWHDVLKRKALVMYIQLYQTKA